MTLAATEVSVEFDGDGVLAEVSISVDPCEILTVVGPSGTGKTTLLRLLATFRPPDSGTVEWDGTDVWSLSRADRLSIRRRLSMVFQEPSLFNAPVHRNVTYGNRVRRSWDDRFRDGVRGLIGDPRLHDAARAALETVGLADKADRNALSLSGGEAQRVAFARALATDPSVMLLDEPTSNLDPRNTAVLEEAILQARDRGVGVVVATHDMHQAERISDRLGFIYDGELVETGSPERIFEEPTDPRTERFVDGELLYEPDDDGFDAATAGIDRD
ncbi:MAG: tungstate transport system ATP-binding protein [Halobacteriales archaeon]|jgi:tungstate transport system ATP-binding protein